MQGFQAQDLKARLDRALALARRRQPSHQLGERVEGLALAACGLLATPGLELLAFDAEPIQEVASVELRRFSQLGNARSGSKAAEGEHVDLERRGVQHDIPV